MYYVYALTDPRTDIPFYIGKGKGGGCYSHLRDDNIKNENRRKAIIIERIRKLGMEPKVEIIRYFDDERAAYAAEEKIINLFGRMGYDHNGILSNVWVVNKPSVYRGEAHPRYGSVNSTEHRKKISDTRKYRLSIGEIIPYVLTDADRAKGQQKLRAIGHNIGEKNPMCGRKHKESTKLQISQSRKGTTQSEDQIKKRVSSMKARSPEAKEASRVRHSKSIREVIFRKNRDKYYKIFALLDSVTKIKMKDIAKICEVSVDTVTNVKKDRKKLESFFAEEDNAVKK